MCLCDPHVFTASDSELGVFVFLPWGALLSHNEREKAEQEEFSQTERGMTNALTHTEIGRGSRSCWSSPLLLPPLSLRAGGVYLAAFGLCGRGSVIVQQHPAVLFCLGG